MFRRALQQSQSDDDWAADQRAWKVLYREYYPVKYLLKNEPPTRCPNNEGPDRRGCQGFRRDTGCR